MRCALVTLIALGCAPTPQTPNPATADQVWWKHAVVYEIYPRSFQDSDGDGVGDLNGISQRLDYLQRLGVDAIWITPMYPSPQVDFGYDISDYENIDPQYGTLADFDRLIAEAKHRDIRVVVDVVLNHTSDRHAWFVASASARTDPKHDWYVWSDGKPGTGPGSHDGRIPPNNWESLFGGSAWEWSPTAKQFYYHKFYKQQPDLNWRNPDVEKAMFAVMRFWLDRGVAGFRLDAIPTLFEDPQLRDEPVTGGTNAFGDLNLKDIYTNNLPEVHDVIRRMRAMASTYAGDRVLIGETYLPTTAELDLWYGGAAHDQLHLPMDMLLGFQDQLSAGSFRKSISDVETLVHGSQPLFVFNNHDQHRSWDRFGNGTDNLQIAKIIATLLLTSRATALMYYGEELGMVTTTPARVEDVKDPIGITGWPKEKGRDGERTPMQWDHSNAQAGFSTNAKTWLPVAASYVTVNVETEHADPDSLLVWYERLIQLRRSSPALRDGGVVMLDVANPKVLSFMRTGPHVIVVSLNMSAQPQTVSLGRKLGVKTVMTTASSLSNITSVDGLVLPPFASWIGEAQP